ncbi:MAG: hypothetical protein U0805_13720 [Pirellulales bacterium]
MATVGAPAKPGASPPPPAPPKPRAESTKREAARRNGRPPTIVCALITLWLVWHFSAIFLAAMAIPGPTSPLVNNIAEHPKSPVLWYLNALYLNQGHSFFAPEVGPGHVIHYELFDKNNQPAGSGFLPDKKEHWPRLLYHRHMMLADQIEMMSPEEGKADQHRKAYLEAFGRQLLRMNRGAQVVRVRLYAHWPLPSDFVTRYGRASGYQKFSQEVSQGGQQHRIDEQGYELVGEAVQRRTDLPPEPEPPPEPKQAFLPAPPPSQNLNWQRERSNVANRWQGGARR